MSFVFDISERFYKQVAASTTETMDYVPINGEKVYVVNAGVSSSSAPQTVAHICWDPGGAAEEVVISSYSEVHHENINRTYTGDGVKIIRISLINDMTEPTFMGAFWEAEKL